MEKAAGRQEAGRRAAQAACARDQVSRLGHAFCYSRCQTAFWRWWAAMRDLHRLGFEVGLACMDCGWSVGWSSSVRLAVHSSPPPSPPHLYVRHAPMVLSYERGVVQTSSASSGFSGAPWCWLVDVVWFASRRKRLDCQPGGSPSKPWRLGWVRARGEARRSSHHGAHGSSRQGALARCHRPVRFKLSGPPCFVSGDERKSGEKSAVG